MQNIKWPWFTALDLSINDMFKLSNQPGLHGWHAGMVTVLILDQLSLVSSAVPTLPGLSFNASDVGQGRCRGGGRGAAPPLCPGPNGASTRYRDD